MEPASDDQLKEILTKLFKKAEEDSKGYRPLQLIVSPQMYKEMVKVANSDSDMAPIMRSLLGWKKDEKRL